MQILIFVILFLILFFILLSIQVLFYRAFKFAMRGFVFALDNSYQQLGYFILVIITGGMFVSFFVQIIHGTNIPPNFIEFLLKM